MPTTNWDELLNQYDTSFNPKYPKTDPFSYPTQQGGMSPQGGMGLGGQVPEYDFAPMRRYKDYLNTEPTREQYKPGKFGTVLNSLSAGFEAMNNGIGRGVGLYDALEGRDYDKAYGTWQNRAKKYQTDVELENTRYKTATTDYDRAEDNKRQKLSVDISGRNADTNEARLALEEKKYNDSGFQLSDGPNGTRIGVRLRGGQQEQIPTEIPNVNLTPQQRIDQFNTREDNTMKRWREPGGAAKLAAQTSIRNVDAGIKSRESEGFQNRQSAEWRDVTGPTTKAEKVPTPTNTRTLQGLIENGYPEFNKPGLIEFDPASGTLGIEVDDKLVAGKLREMAGTDDEMFKNLVTRWKKFKEVAVQYPTPVRRGR